MEFIYQASPQERSSEASTTLDENLGETFAGQSRSRALQIQLPRARRHLEQSRSEVLQNPAATRPDLRAAQHPGSIGALAIEFRRRRYAQLGIDQNPDGPVNDALTAASGEFRVVRESRPRSDDNRVDSRAQEVPLRPRFGTGDPARLAGRSRDPAVQRAGQLEHHKGSAERAHHRKAAVLLAAGCLEHAELNLDSRAPQATDARPRTIRVGISMPDKYATDARLQDRFRTGTRAPHPAAGFERDRERCTAQTLDAKAAPRAFERDDFSVWSADRSRRSATQQAIAAKNRGADRRVRIRAPRYPAGCPQGDPHRRFGCHRGRSIDSKNRR
jgi:hypothetical protein